MCRSSQNVSNQPRNTGPLPGPATVSSPEVLGGGDVRGLKALVALHDFELDALTLGQRLVAVHLDRAEKWTNTSSPPSRSMKP